MLVRLALLIAVSLGIFTSACAGEKEALYEIGFEEVEVGEVPADFLVLEGEFGVAQVEGNKVLELPGTPVSDFSVLLGPAETENIEVQARFRGENTKRRFPVFGVGSSGISGYRLQVNPARRELELYRLGEVVSATSFAWKSGEWTHLKLQVTKAGEGKWSVQGKAWVADGDEPKDWLLTFEDSEQPLTGRPTLWGTPYAEKPIHFDDFSLTKTGE
jgi:hypothetical protein